MLHVTPLPDAITCDLVKIGVSRQPNGQCTIADRCRKETAHCHLPNFAASQRTRLQKFADYLTTHAQVLKDQARIERLLTTVLEDSQAILGQSTCWPLGDIVIALQVPADALLWTRDADFRPLAEALGLQLYTPSFDFDL
ncbi:MAG: hypothetical protein R3A44_32430 [Caldilineaceae bacterium]